MKKFFCIVLVVFLSGCALTTWTRLTGDEYEDSRRKFKTVIPEGWMRYNMAKYFLVTKDGMVLNQIAVERYKFDKDLEFTKKKFSEGMAPQDLAETEIANFKASDVMDKLEVSLNRPETISGQPGFRIEYAYIAQGGLKMRGIHCGFIYDERVYRIRYEAASQYYFERYLNVFDQFLKNFRLLEG